MVLLGSDGEQVALVARQRFTERLPGDVLLLDWVSQDGVELLVELGVRIWVAVSKEDVVIIVLELIAEGQGVERPGPFDALLAYAILVIGNLGASSMPPNVLLLSVPL